MPGALVGMAVGDTGQGLPNKVLVPPCASQAHIVSQGSEFLCCGSGLPERESVLRSSK